MRFWGRYTRILLDLVIDLYGVMMDSAVGKGYNNITVTESMSSGMRELTEADSSQIIEKIFKEFDENGNGRFSKF